MSSSKSTTFKTLSDLNKLFRKILLKLDEEILGESILKELNYEEANRLIAVLQELVVTVSLLSTKSQQVYNKSIDMLTNLQESIGILQVHVENKLSSESAKNVFKTSSDCHNLNKKTILDLIR